MIKTKVLLFGVLAEAAGTTMLMVENNGDTSSLEEKIYADFPQFRDYSFRLSVNHKMVDGVSSLSDGDEVALLPPFAGG